MQCSHETKHIVFRVKRIFYPTKITHCTVIILLISFRGYSQRTCILNMHFRGWFAGWNPQIPLNNYLSLYSTFFQCLRQKVKSVSINIVCIKCDTLYIHCTCMGRDCTFIIVPAVQYWLMCSASYIKQHNDTIVQTSLKDTCTYRDWVKRITHCK